MPEVTLVMTVFNGELFLPAALESIMAQSMRDFAIIVVNDGSTDRTAEILEEYAGRSKRMQIVHQQNTGIVDAANRACTLVRTPYIARMDADDISLPDRLERQLSFLQRRREVALLGGAAEFINESGDVLFAVDVPTHQDEIKALLPERNVFVHSAVVMRRDALLAVGGYRRAFSDTAGDYDLWLRLVERYEAANLPEVIVRYRVHRRQTTTMRLEEQTLAALGARLSARLRRSGRPDPFDAMNTVTRDTLIRLGMTAVEIEKEVARVAGSWANVMGEAGHHDTAVTLAREAWRGQRGLGLTRDDVSRHQVAAARASLGRGRIIQGLGAAVQAIRWQPALLGRVMRGGFRRIARWVRRGPGQKEM
jgi:glycosyltransferase involved in cell wall biosynthesis